MRRVLHIIVAGLFALAFLPLAAPPAHAEATSSLTIVKTMGEGEVAGAPLAGITFRLNRILDVDAGTPEGLAAAVAADPTLLTDAGAHPLGPAIDVLTGADGHAVAASLPDGVYLVRELPSRTGDVAWSVIAPFLVALPGLGDAAAPRDVVVHAKNQPLTVSGSITPGVVAPGEDVTLEFVGTVPAPDRDGALHRYHVVAEFDPVLIDRAATGVWLQTSTGPVVLGAEDYTTWVDPATGDLVVELTPAGLARLAALRLHDPSVRVHVDYAARVAPDADGGTQVWARFALFTDGWPPPMSSADLDEGAGSADVAVARAVVRLPGSAEPAPTPPGARPGLAGLPHTGAVATATLGGSGLALTAFLLLLLARRRRDDEEQPVTVSTSTNPTAREEQR